MKIEELQKTFPSGISIPDALAQLCAWHEANGYPISGYFELRADTYEAIRHWFGNDSVVDRFGVFGAGPDGSLFAIWRQADGRQPIAHLGSEGVNNFVLASDFVSFLRLLAVGYGEIGFDDLSQPTTEPPNEPFQRWVSDTFSVSIPSTGAEITEPARAAHDDFDQWIQTKIQ